MRNSCSAFTHRCMLLPPSCPTHRKAACDLCHYTIGGAACLVGRGVVWSLRTAVRNLCEASAEKVTEPGFYKPGTFRDTLVQPGFDISATILPEDLSFESLLDQLDPTHPKSNSLGAATLAFYQGKLDEYYGQRKSSALRYYQATRQVFASKSSVKRALQSEFRSASALTVRGRCQLLLKKAIGPACAATGKFAPVCVAIMNGLSYGLCVTLTNLLAESCSAAVNFVIKASGVDSWLHNDCLNSMCARCQSDGCYGTEGNPAFVDTLAAHAGYTPPAPPPPRPEPRYPCDPPDANPLKPETWESNVDTFRTEEALELHVIRQAFGLQERAVHNQPSLFTNWTVAEEPGDVNYTAQDTARVEGIGSEDDVQQLMISEDMVAQIHVVEMGDGQGGVIAALAYGECEEGDCKYGGACSKNGVSCDCIDGRTGAYCEIYLGEPSSIEDTEMNTQNGVEAPPGGHGYVGAGPWTGLLIEIPVPMGDQVDNISSWEETEAMYESEFTPFPPKGALDPGSSRDTINNACGAVSISDAMGEARIADFIEAYADLPCGREGLPENHSFPARRAPLPRLAYEGEYILVEAGAGAAVSGPGAVSNTEDDEGRLSPVYMQSNTGSRLVFREGSWGIWPAGDKCPVRISNPGTSVFATHGAQLELIHHGSRNNLTLTLPKPYIRCLAWRAAPEVMVTGLSADLQLDGLYTNTGNVSSDGYPLYVRAPLQDDMLVGNHGPEPEFPAPPLYLYSVSWPNQNSVPYGRIGYAPLRMWVIGRQPESVELALAHTTAHVGAPRPEDIGNYGNWTVALYAGWRVHSPGWDFYNIRTNATITRWVPPGTEQGIGERRRGLNEGDKETLAAAEEIGVVGLAENTAAASNIFSSLLAVPLLILALLLLLWYWQREAKRGTGKDNVSALRQKQSTAAVPTRRSALSSKASRSHGMRQRSLTSHQA